jgi:hypothetical protein
VVGKQEIGITCATGSSYDFPLDSYEFAFNVFSTSANVSDYSTIGFWLNVSQLPVVGFMPTSYMIAPADAQSTTRVHVKFSRSWVTTLYPVLVAIGMWGIIIAELIVLYLHYVRKEKVVVGAIAFYTALLFALPSLRNSTTTAPIGCAFDYWAFFWSEVTTMTCIFWMAGKHYIFVCWLYMY